MRPSNTAIFLSIGYVLLGLGIALYFSNDYEQKQQSKEKIVYEDVDTVVIDKEAWKDITPTNNNKLFDDTLAVMVDDTLRWIRFRVSGGDPHTRIYLQGGHIKQVGKTIKGY
jgi:hypothetical protein